jgi:hypothetical protein
MLDWPFMPLFAALKMVGRGGVHCGYNLGLYKKATTWLPKGMPT